MTDTNFISITSHKNFSPEDFFESLGTKLYYTAEENIKEKKASYYFYRKESTTAFMLDREGCNYFLAIDPFASYPDFQYFPYLLDSLHIYLKDRPFFEYNKSAFELFDEEWISYIIGEEVAYLKCMLNMGRKFLFFSPITVGTYVDEEILKTCGVTLYSSTPRIYGYIQYLLKQKLLPVETLVSIDDDVEEEEEIIVDVPQHKSIGTVLSWQIDGAETTESYAQEDTDLLLKLAESHQAGEKVHCVVLNDIATIHQYGIGCEANVKKAIYWFNEAIKAGDYTYAPTSLGDIYRKGWSEVEPDLKKALEAYFLSTDPYAWYRIGQAYEEGWTDAPNLKLAMSWYKRAADVGHHLAIKRLSTN